MQRRTKIIIGIAAAIVLAGGAFYWFFLRSDAPPPVDIESAVESVTTTTAAPAEGETTTTTATTTPEALAGFDGTWVVETDASFVGYRVKEELASIGLFEAVGRTSGLDASLTIEGTTVTSVDLLADMTQLSSDDSRRDGAIKRQALETNDFPEASFVLAGPIDLGSIPDPGVTVSFEATGDLTIHGVTNRVTIPLDAQTVDGKIVVVGSAPVVFADYGIDPPSAAIVLSVEDNGIFEFQLVFARSAG